MPGRPRRAPPAPAGAPLRTRHTQPQPEICHPFHFSLRKSGDNTICPRKGRRAHCRQAPRHRGEGATRQDGIGATATVTSGDALIAAGTKITIHLTLAAENASIDDFKVISSTASSTGRFSIGNETPLLVDLIAPEDISLQELVKISISGLKNAGSVSIVSSSISVDGVFQIVEHGQTVTTIGNLFTSGTAAGDKIVGDIGNDSLKGLSGDDTLLGGAGNDTLDGGKGTDHMTGGSGDDTYIVDHVGDVVREATGQGLDHVRASVSYTLSNHVEVLTLTGTKALAGTGNALANSLSGNSGANRLNGMSGNDTLTGGAGGDTLTGGKGADTFTFLSVTESLATTKGRDTISDFSRPQGDRIDLSAIDANSPVEGHQDFVFLGTAAFGKTGGELRTQKYGTGTLLLGEVNGDGKADFAVFLAGITSLRESDFVL